MNNNTRVFGIGTAALDFRIMTADYGKDYKDKLLAQKIDIFGGGSAANCLIQVCRLGGKATWLGKLGNDWIGKEISRQLEQEGIDCSEIIVDEVCSPFNVAIYAGEEKRRVGGFLLPNSLGQINKEDIEKFTKNIKQGDWCLVEIGEIQLDMVNEFCTLVKRKGSKIVVDVDLDPIKQCNSNLEIVEQIFQKADVLIPNVTSMKSIYPDMDAIKITEAIAEDYQVHTVVTAGQEGAFYCMPGEEVAQVKSCKTKIVDTVGAGDAFHGGMIFGLLNGYTLEKAIDLGNKCGAYNCKRTGARTAMPTKEELGL